jgi:hypothetical protein
VVNYDSGKAVVADAPIVFSFVEGRGDITSQGITDANGISSAIIRSVSPGEQGVFIRAMLSISNKGKIRLFPEVCRDFTYIATPTTARVVVYEGHGTGMGTVTTQSPLVESISSVLVQTGLDCIPIDARLEPELFIRSMQGDSTALMQLSTLAGTTVSYVALASIQYDEPQQLIVNGKAYAIFTTNAEITFRMVRSDGSIVVVFPSLYCKAQAGTAAASIQAVLQESRKMLEQELTKRMQDVRNALEL